MCSSELDSLGSGVRIEPVGAAVCNRSRGVQQVGFVGVKELVAVDDDLC